MNNSVQKRLLEILKEKDISECHIFHILSITRDNENLAEKVINFLNDKQPIKYLYGDILHFVLGLNRENNEKSDELSEIIMEENSNDTYEPLKSAYTVKYNHEINNGILNVSFNDSDIGLLRILTGSKINYFSAHLALAFMGLDDLKKDSRQNISQIDLYKRPNEDVLYDFQDEVTEFLKNVNNYNKIVIWIKSNDSNAYFLPYYFINRFYEQIKDREIAIIYTDGYKNRKGLDELRIGEFEELIKTERTLTLNEINDYKDKWNEIVNNKCDIRNVVDCVINYTNVEDYYDVILDRLSQKGEINRIKFIGELMFDDKIIHGGILDIYSYIIDKLIEKKLIASDDYNIPQYIPNDKISVVKE